MEMFKGRRLLIATKHQKEKVMAPLLEKGLGVKDRTHELEIFARELSTHTNFGGQEVHSEEALNDFAGKHHFPSHALILRKKKDDLKTLTKGIADSKDLKNIFYDLSVKHGSSYVETDMRAMFNPTRMTVIEKAVQNLLLKIKSLCPQCNSPGFGITQVRSGLPCMLCGKPTRSPIANIFLCQKCSFLKEEMYPSRIAYEDPTFCDYCNP